MKRYKCSECGKSFKTKKGLHVHQSLRHKKHPPVVPWSHVMVILILIAGLFVFMGLGETGNEGVQKTSPEKPLIQPSGKVPVKKSAVLIIEVEPVNESVVR
ncbi:MAG: hypothetical protein DRP11_03400 [Candidatus Aenigmatarchaeota archaeon]|nr:MAG: hypothetical protein DRP11_03400 [Candidatus Aenigmarchaeota archaeon]